MFGDMGGAASLYRKASDTIFSTKSHNHVNS